MKLAFTIGKKEFSFSTKASPEATAWLRGDDVDANAEGARLVMPYVQSSWVYTAVSILAENVAQIPFRICQVPASGARDLGRCKDVSSRRRLQRNLQAENIVDSGPVVDLFEHPHPSLNKALYWEMLMTWRCLRGEFFVIPLDGRDSTAQPVEITPSAMNASRSARVQSLLTLEPGLFWQIVTGYELAGWRYTGSPLLSPLPSQLLLPNEVVQSRTPNPYLFWRGLAPLSVAMLAAGSDYAASQFMKGLMMNNADTGVIVTTEQQATKEQREAIMAALRDRKRKAGTPDRPLFLWGGATLEKPSISSADGQFLEHRNQNRDEIFAVFKVPPSMAGIQARGGRSLGGGGEMEQDKANFIEGTVSPHCRALEAAHRPIVKMFGADLDCYFDIDSLPILQSARRLRVDSAVKAFAMGVPFNRADEVYDLGFGPVPGGDKGYLPFNLQPVDEVGQTAPTVPPGEPTEPQDPMDKALRCLEGLSFKLQTPEAGRQAGNIQRHVCGPSSPEHEALLKEREKALKSRVVVFWNKQKGRILSRLPEVMKEFVREEIHNKSPDVVSYKWTWKPKSQLSRGLDEVFDNASEDEKLLKALKPVLIHDLNVGGAALYKEIGLDNFEIDPKDAIEFLNLRKNEIKGINQTTWDRLKTSLQEGLQAGEPMSDLQSRVQAFFSGQEGRANVIAGTETNVAINSGRQQAMVTAKVPRKGWQTSHLEGTRPTHQECEDLSKEDNGIPIDEEWPNGCSYPGDPEGAAEETINCRCFGFAILDEGNGGEEE